MPTASNTAVPYRDHSLPVDQRVADLVARMLLEPGESRSVALEITPKQLAFWNLDMERVVESGDFAVMTGPNSVELQTTTLTVA